jgi:DNA-binding response OmpR family regulator
MNRVLVVDDDADIRELVTFKLQQAGYTVQAASDGQLGLDAALANTPDLILLDLMMPKLSGIEVCRLLRDNDATADTPVILFTAKAQEADVQRGFSAGADDYIVKPFSPRRADHPRPGRPGPRPQPLGARRPLVWLDKIRPRSVMAAALGPGAS